jgi:chemotaxis protein methyltransferase CheR
MDLTPSELKRLSAVIERRSGMVFTEARWPFLAHRAREVMVRAGLDGHAGWQALETSEEQGRRLYAELEQAIQVHETRFFRYESHHRILADTVLPALVKPGTTGPPRVRIWSVGCATGEEPYSIAMTLVERLPALAAGGIELIASDVSRDAIAVAERGVYGVTAVAAVPPAYRARYFTVDGDTFTVTPELRQVIRFFQHDARRGLFVGKFDAVFCCNVLLYFPSALKRLLLRRLAEALRQGGYLFLGHADGIVPPAEWFEARRLPSGFVYRRRRGRD